MAKTGYLKVNVRTDKEGRCVVQPLDGGSEFYTDQVYLTLTKDIVDLLDKEMSDKRAADYLANHGWKVVTNEYFAEAPERKEKRDVTKNNEIVIDVKTRGMEEAHEQIEALADAYDGFPAQVNIKGARDCVFNIYPSQTKIIGMDSDPEGGGQG